MHISDGTGGCTGSGIATTAEKTSKTETELEIRKSVSALAAPVAPRVLTISKKRRVCSSYPRRGRFWSLVSFRTI